VRVIFIDLHCNGFVLNTFTSLLVKRHIATRHKFLVQGLLKQGIHIVDASLTHRESDIATSRIECCSLDDILGDEKVTFIKVDIEGAELMTIEGAKKDKKG